ncbi:DNA-primase RepB domain-containing protein [Salmonirosea aquatica]|uniref:RepB-like DNA primase domain-containing protein n=1 Tax=Salmonirosea aquatica TaxID=2654236 RepID=A0A7C9BCI2_9BACT|nr:hypothetical protein [Cytophagaceae bacterium SJW1-29]
MTNRTWQAVENTLMAIDASEYIIRLIHDEKPPINKRLEAAQLIREIPYYQAKNREGYNVYFRPAGYEFVLLDDLYRQVLSELAELKPCLLLETSPGNYQAWLRLREVPQTREEAVNICQELAVLLAADLGSAEPDHIGRLPGFTNRKPRHRRDDGFYPFVRLHKWENRDSDFSPLGGLLVKHNLQLHPLSGTKTTTAAGKISTFAVCFSARVNQMTSFGNSWKPPARKPGRYAGRMTTSVRRSGMRVLGSIIS